MNNRKPLVAVLSLLAGIGMLTSCGTPAASSVASSAASSAAASSVAASSVAASSEVASSAAVVSSEEKVPDYCKGFYEAAIGGGAYKCYVILHTNGVYYASFANDGMKVAGYYDYSETSIDYTYKDGDNDVTVTCPAQIHCTEFSGKEVGSYGLKDGVLYGFKAISWAVNWTQNTKDALPITEEGKTVITFTLEGNEFSTLELKHTGTYIDTLGADEIDGTWAKTDNGFVLTSDKGEKYTVVYNEDKTKATYTDPKGATLTILPPVVEVDQYLLTGTYKGTEDGAVTYGANVHLYESKNALVEITVEGTVNSTVTGTWTIDDATKNITLKIGETNVDITYNANLDQYTANYVLVNNGTTVATIPVATALNAYFTFTGASMLILKCFKTGTGELFINYGGERDTGIAATWTFEKATYKLGVAIGGVDQTLTMDTTTHAYSFTYTASLGGNDIKDTLTCPASEWGKLAA